MRNTYIVLLVAIGIPSLPIILIGVFGLRLFGTEIIVPFLSSGITQNFAVLSAPIFVLGILTSVIVVEFSQYYDNDTN